MRLVLMAWMLAGCLGEGDECGADEEGEVVCVDGTGLSCVDGTWTDSGCHCRGLAPGFQCPM